MDLNKFYNHIKICINGINILLEYVIPAYQSIHRHSEFE